MANLYLLTQNSNVNYDTYTSAVVCARTEADARLIHPSGEMMESDEWDWIHTRNWANHVDDVMVKLIGKAVSGTELNSVIIASYNAG